MSHEEYKKCMRCKAFEGKCHSEDPNGTCPNWSVADNVFRMVEVVPVCVLCNKEIPQEPFAGVGRENRIHINNKIFRPICQFCMMSVIGLMETIYENELPEGKVGEPNRYEKYTTVTDGRTSQT